MTRIVVTDPLVARPEIPADVLVITPHAASARALNVPLIRLSDIAEGALKRAGIRAATAIEARRMLKAAVRRVLPGTDAGAYASRIREILNTVVRTGIDLDELAEHGSPRVRQFARVGTAYAEELASRSLIDPEAAMIEASRLSIEPRPMLIYGYFRARAEEILFIDRAAGEGSIYFLPCGADDIFTSNRHWAGDLAGHGWQIEERASFAGSHAGRALAGRFLGGGEPAPGEAFSFADIESEIRHVLGRSKQAVLAGTGADDIAIICGKPERYAKQISAVAAEYGLPVRFSHSVPLQETRVGSFVRQIFETIAAEHDFESTSRLVRHPLSPAIKPESWASARRSHTRGLDGWTELLPDACVLDWPASYSFEEGAEKLYECMRVWRLRETAAMRAADITAYDCFVNTLAETVKGETEPHPHDAFATLVFELLTTTGVRFDPSAVGVTVHDAKGVIGAEFEHLYFLSMAEGVVPAAASDNPVVDFHERKSLAAHGIKFESAAEVARWEAAEFYFALLAARGSATFTFPGVLEGAEKIKSPFLERLGLKPGPPGPTPASSSEELRRLLIRRDGTAGDALTEDARSRFAIEILRERQPGQTEYDGVIGSGPAATELFWSVSQFTSFGQCAFKWFASRLLGLAPPDEMADSLDARTMGSLYHKALEIAVSRSMEAADIRAAVLEQLESAFAEAEADADISLPELADWELQRPEHLKRLRKAVEADDFISLGSRVLAVEQEYRGEWQGLRMKGYIDRIDETPNGLVAIDYKTSSKPPNGIKDESMMLKTDVQLPLYTEVALRNLYPDKQLGTGAYYSLTKGKTLKSAGLEGLPKLEQFAAELKEALAAGRFAVGPDMKKQACTYCDVGDVCRFGTRHERGEGYDRSE